MRAYLVTGNPGSGKSAACGELSQRGLTTVDTDDLAFWEDSAGSRWNSHTPRMLTGSGSIAGSGAGPGSSSPSLRLVLPPGACSSAA
jgi:hypothetical protein